MNQIRPTARCIFRRNNQVLLVRVYDPDFDEEPFLVPSGGGIDFGEHSSEAAVREVMEETGCEATNLKLLGLVENLFRSKVKEHHELVFIYEADFADKTLYELDELPITESNGMKFTAYWYDIDWLKKEHIPTYPTGILNIL